MLHKDKEIRFVPVSEVHRFVKQCYMAVGTPEDIAEAQAMLQSSADERGFFDEGVQKLDQYLQDIISGLCDPTAKPMIAKEKGSAVLVNGNNGLGAYTGIFCMNKAIEKARQSGVGWVTCKNANDNGMESFYSLIALRQGMIGFSLSNSSPVIVPTRAKTCMLGMNPICMGAPTSGDDYFLLDMATSAVALKKIEDYKNNKWPMPVGWAVDSTGNPTEDADCVYENPNIMPLGGTEGNSGYKGTALAMLVEILCGITSNAKYGQHIERMNERKKPLNLGQCYIAVDPQSFAPGFEDRMEDLLNQIRSLPPVDESKPVLVPGDRERNNTAKVKQNGGIQFYSYQLNMCNKLASQYSIEPMKDKHGYIVTSSRAHGYICKSNCNKYK